MPEHDTRQAALDYLGRGWSVIPVRPRAKIPALRWQKFQHERATVADVERWFHKPTDANIGIVTGVVSHLAVLDIDPRHGGNDSLRELEQVHMKLPDTVESVTGGGGRHLYFLLPSIALPSRVGLRPGIDLRADGGMVVAPPSVHPSGALYQWRAGHDPRTMALAILPSWMAEMVLHASLPRGHAIEYWRDLVQSGVEQGKRNSTMASLAGHLFWHGVDTDVVAELLLCWNRVRCRPPLDDDEVARTITSIARLHATGRVGASGGSGRL